MHTKTRLTRLARATAAAGVAAASLLGMAQTASAAPPLYTETTLNQGKSLAVSPSGTVIVAPPSSDSSQRWEANSRAQVVGGVIKFGYELRRPGGTTCIADLGANVRVGLRNCDTQSGSNAQATTQIWQFKFGRTVNGKNYYFWENAKTTRRLMLDQFSNEGPFPSFTVIASPLKANPGTAAEACQLWNEVRVA